MPASHLYTRTSMVVILSTNSGACYFGTNNYVTIRPIQLAFIPFKLNVRLENLRGQFCLKHGRCLDQLELIKRKSGML